MFKLVVLFYVLALASAKPGWVTPVTYSVTPAISSVSHYSNSVLHGSPVVPTVYGGYSPVISSVGVVPAVATLSQAPNSPAVVLDAVNGIPLDTPEVVAARVAHYQAKALAGVHSIAKRSAVAPVTYSSIVSPVAAVAPVSSVAPVTPLVRSVVSPVAYPSPFVSTYTAPLATGYTYSTVIPKTLSVHPW